MIGSVLAAGALLALSACGSPTSATEELTAAGASAQFAVPAAEVPAADSAAAPAAVKPPPSVPSPGRGGLEAVDGGEAADSPAVPAAQRPAPGAPLTDRFLRPADLGSGWLMQKPDDEAADVARHQYCGPAFVSDQHRLERVARNYAREDGLRVQQEINRYRTDSEAERAVAEFAAAFEGCREYEPQPGVRVELAPWDPPALAQSRVGATMIVTPAAHPPVHATLAVYRTGPLLMVVSVVAERPEPSMSRHQSIAPTAVRRADLQVSGPTEQETR